jgi:membrane protein implicated in regulation of membrane protease activity
MNWFFTWEFWVIAGIVLMILESLEGSFNFFLPVSIGSFICALFVYLFPDSTWKQLLLVFSISSGVSFLILKRFLKMKEDKDISDY